MNAPHHPHHAQGEGSIGWGLIGASTIAAQHMIPAIRNQEPLPNNRDPNAPQITDSWIVGLFSHNTSRARSFADTHYIPHFYVNLADLLENPAIQCVYISGHPRHRTASTLAALSAGKHVLCETPLALSIDDGLAMTHTAARHGLILAVNHHLRADPALHKMRQLLAEGFIGDILGGRLRNTTLLHPKQQTWRLQTPGGGVVFDRTIHDIDLIHYLLRAEIAHIHSISGTQILGDTVEYTAGNPARNPASNPVEEDVLSHITLRRSNITIHLHDSFHLPHDMTQLEIYGSAGTLSASHCFTNDAQSELHLWRHGNRQAISTGTTSSYLTSSYHTSVAMFTDAVRQQSRPLATGTDGLRSLNVALTAHTSIWRRHGVDIPPLPHPHIDRSIP